MSKLKTFNISSFVDDAAVNVVPQKNYNTESETSPSSIVAETVDSPNQNNQNNGEATNDQKQEPAKGQRGRKKSLRTIPRQNGKVVFLEIEADAALARISVLQRVDKQDVIRTALDEFLKNHYDGNNLDAKGSQLLTEYINKTTLFE